MPHRFIFDSPVVPLHYVWARNAVKWRYLPISAALNVSILWYRLGGDSTRVENLRYRSSSSDPIEIITDRCMIDRFMTDRFSDRT